MSAGRDGRRWALILGLVGLGAGAVATRFRVAFVTDPLGPRAFPWLAAALLVLGAVGLARHPGDDAEWPDPPARRRIAGVVVALLLWTVALPFLGFVAATTLLLAGLGRLFGARWGPGLAAGICVSGVLYLLFAWGLGLALPAGPWG